MDKEEKKFKMLTIKELRSFTGECTIDGKVVERYAAEVDINSPNEVPAIRETQLNRALCMNNINQCREDRKEFEDYVYELVKSMQTKEDDSNDDEADV